MRASPPGKNHSLAKIRSKLNFTKDISSESLRNKTGLNLQVFRSLSLKSGLNRAKAQLNDIVISENNEEEEDDEPGSKSPKQIASNVLHPIV
mgnify:CR=1 FL=1